MDSPLLLLSLLLVGCAALAWWRGGGEQLGSGLARGGAMLLRFGPVVAVSFLAAGLVETLVPETWLREHLGPQSGFRGLVLATGVGILTPSGPFVVFPLAAALLRNGAGVGVVVAYVCAWSLLAAHRFIAWEIPILGLRLAALRWLLCCALPILIGMAARSLTRALSP